MIAHSSEFPFHFADFMATKQTAGWEFPQMLVKFVGVGRPQKSPKVRFRNYSNLPRFLFQGKVYMGVSEDYFPFPRVGYVSSLEGNILGGGLKDFLFLPRYLGR